MACLVENGYVLGCRDNIGGVKKVLIGNFDADAEYTFTDGDITATTSAVSYQTFEQEMETATFNQTGTFSTENGTVFYTQDVGLIFHKNNTASRNTLIVLAQANLSIIVQDQRDEYWLVGIANGARATAGAMNTGKAFGDMNGSTITLQSKEALPAYRIADISVFTVA